MQIQAHISDLIKASSMTSYAEDRNYEMMETLGDSLLKYIMCKTYFKINNIY